ncbi:MAG: delta-aminolevulinic acid dehydratase, partial [Sodaliphilus sp.]|nr:delta-aminolevulinic acid dehydratase [Sodaliphilus sp.]
ASDVLRWTIKHMQDKKGYFYYQLKKGISSKISYMRWSNAFMFCALSYYLLSEIENEENKTK